MIKRECRFCVSSCFGTSRPCSGEAAQQFALTICRGSESELRTEAVQQFEAEESWALTGRGAYAARSVLIIQSEPVGESVWMPLEALAMEIRAAKHEYLWFII